jgi:hypothetical protein
MSPPAAASHASTQVTGLVLRFSTGNRAGNAQQPIAHAWPVYHHHQHCPHQHCPHHTTHHHHPPPPPPPPHTDPTWSQNSMISCISQGSSSSEAADGVGPPPAFSSDAPTVPSSRSSSIPPAPLLPPLDVSPALLVTGARGPEGRRLMLYTDTMLGCIMQLPMAASCGRRFKGRADAPRWARTFHAIYLLR